MSNETPVAEAVETPQDPALAELTARVKHAQTVHLAVRVGKGDPEYVRVNKSDVIALAAKYGVPLVEVRGKYLFIKV